MSGNLGELGALHNPRNVQQITEAAQEYEYDAAIPLRYWLRSAQAMLKEVGNPFTSLTLDALSDLPHRQIYTFVKETKKQHTFCSSAMPI